jgi:hypothetical protein
MGRKGGINSGWHIESRNIRRNWYKKRTIWDENCIKRGRYGKGIGWYNMEVTIRGGRYKNRCYNARAPG